MSAAPALIEWPMVLWNPDNKLSNQKESLKYKWEKKDISNIKKRYVEWDLGVLKWPLLVCRYEERKATCSVTLRI